jgi:predicted ATPase
MTKAFLPPKSNASAKHLESSLRRKAAKLGYQLIPLPQTA